MAAISDVPYVVDKKGGSYFAVAPRLELDGPFKAKTADGADKPESRWTSDERRVVNQDQCLKSILLSCLPDDIIESVISCEIAKDTWTDLVYSFEGPSDTKENRIIDLKLEYQTFRAKTSKSLSHTYTRYKNLLNELVNDGVTLSKHEINVGFVNSLPEKWLSFSQEFRNANHTQTLDLADIYGRFIYEDNLISRRYSDTKKALITTPSDSPISTAFFSNNIVQGFQENSDDEADERTSEEYLRDLDIEFHERALLANSKRFIKRKNYFSIQKANEDTECYKCSKKCNFARDCFSKTFEPSYKYSMSNSSVKRGFQPKFTPKFIQSTQHAQSSQGEPKVHKDYKDEEEVFDNEEETRVQVLMALANDGHSVGNNHARNGEWIDITMKKLTESSSKNDAKDIPFVPASLDYDYKMIPKSKDWDERLNPDNKLLNFNTGRILVPESKVVNECLQLTEVSSDFESSKESGFEPQTPLSPLKNLQGASPSSEILKSKAKPYPPCTHYGFNDHRTDDCKNYLECEICRSYDHFTSEHNIIIQIRDGVLDESSQSSESSISVSCTTYGNSVHSTTATMILSTLRERHIKEPIWYPDSRCSRSMTGVKSYLHKYVEQPGPKVVFGDNSSCITKGYGSINCGGIVFYKDHLGKFDAEANDRYFLGYPFNSIAFRVFNIRKRQIEETCHVTFDVSVEAIRCLRDQHIKIINIIGDPGKGMLTRSMAANVDPNEQIFNSLA
ncbi:hypothetical protein Tco_1438497 [Tanacetum coccineum]